MMRKDIVGIKAEQRLTRIIIADTTPKGINNAFNKLIKELTIIADLFTPRRKPGVGKGCPWWCPTVDDATARAKQEYRSYLAAPTNPRWKNYKAAVALEKRTVEEAKANSWRRAIAAIAHKQKDLWRLERWARLRSWTPPENIIIPPLQRSESAGDA
jgi:hypothetical protein